MKLRQGPWVAIVSPESVTPSDHLFPLKRWGQHMFQRVLAE